MSSYTIPGVYFEETHPPRRVSFGTGVPAFLGYAGDRAKGNAGREPGGLRDRGSEKHRVERISTVSQFMHLFDRNRGSYLAAALRGFFENGGDYCYTVTLDDNLNAAETLERGLIALDTLTDVDLICIPDAMRDSTTGLALQKQLIAYCDKGQERFAILDPPPNSSLPQVLDQRRDLQGKNAALYYPWLGVSNAGHGPVQHVPPCGHVAGLIARCDRERGFFSAPANQPLAGVLDLETLLTDEMQKEGDPYGVVNCIRAFPGRGIRLWGARTISGQENWRYVNVRRLFLTLNRWLNAAVSGLLFETNTPSLWARLRRTISAYLADLHQRGGLAGAKPEDAFFVLCDQSTTPADVRDQGQVVVEIGIAPLIPAEFIVVKLIVGAGDVIIGAEE